MNPLFEVHKLNKDGLWKAECLALAFAALLDKLSILCPDGREMAIVRTKLEEAAFFAKKAMAKQPENQEIDPEDRTEPGYGTGHIFPFVK